VLYDSQVHAQQVIHDLRRLMRPAEIIQSKRAAGSPS